MHVIFIGVRDPKTVSNESSDAGTVVEFDFTKPETWETALADVDALFLVRPPVVDKSDIGSFVEAAERVGAGRVAYLSTLGAKKNVLVPHHKIEKQIMATDMAYTLLRASFYSSRERENQFRGRAGYWCGCSNRADRIRPH